ncbi:MAG: bifunctional YncE family protein/alkaline phosphatase family protein [Niabella sp.]
MRNRYILTIILSFFSLWLFAQSAQELEQRKTILPNGWVLTPAGNNIQLGDLPLNLVISHNKKYAVVTNNGQSTQSLQLIDVKKQKVIDTKEIAKSWYGLAFSKDDKWIYASGGHDNKVIRYAVKKKKLVEKDTFVLGKKWPNAIGVAGLAVDDVLHQRLFVVTKEDNSLYVFDLSSKKILQMLNLGYENYTCLLSKNREQLYISSWGGKKILVYDISLQKITNEINVGSHPNEMCLTDNGQFLYVANADDNSVSVINTETNKVIETLNAALYPNAPTGSTSNGVALSSDDKTLYIANADNNCLAVYDVSTPSKSISKGFIPVGWYPTNVKVVGKTVLVTNGKGLSSFANPHGPNPVDKKEKVGHHIGDNKTKQKVQYIAGLFTGTLSFIVAPSENQQDVFTTAVYKNTPYTKERELIAAGEPGNPSPSKVGNPSPIKYVFYVIKENRTYDQVLGDVARGNGDSSLCLFGRYYTPNQHKIVDDFVLLDNFYVNAEVSADGHNWSMGAYATDYLEKTWPSSYGNRGGSYPGEGRRKIANNRDGFIWDHCLRNNVSFRTYGEFAGNFKKPNLEVLIGHAADYTGWNLDVRDTTRFYQWQRDFDALVANNAVPQLSTIRLGNDHTQGMRAGKASPYAQVADNDLAVGMLVDYISHSPIWKECAIFILEDDAQNGPDHIDAHRSTAYIVSPFVKRKYIDNTMYSTAGMLRTIELILGMPPMTQYDAAATPMFRCFTNQPDYTTFQHLPSNVNLNDKNPANTKLAVYSNQFDWSKEDGVPDLVFNDILWMGLKGTPAPPPTRSAFLKVKATDDDDDDD